MEDVKSYQFQIFLSFASSAKQTAQRIKKKLEDAVDAKIWIYLNEISVGDKIISKYTKAVMDSHLFIPIITEDYINNSGTTQELEVASTRENQLIRRCKNTDYVFIMPYVGRQDISLLQDNLPQIGYKLAARTTQDLIDSIEVHQKIIQECLSTN